ncbi:MAG TPA: hypothetical protein VNB86_05790 [Gaiellaceae bacterium]|nr:hypothetical protein [Gaiellaceae bacterium]
MVTVASAVVTVAPWWVWLLPVLFSAPWIAAIVWFWPREGFGGGETPSMGELARERLLPR